MESSLSSDFFPTLLNSVAEGIVVVDERGNIVEVNTRITQLFGYTLEEVIGNTIDVFLPAKSRPNHHHNVQSYFHNPSPKLMSERPGLYGQRKDGTQFPVEVSLNSFA